MNLCHFKFGHDVSLVTRVKAVKKRWNGFYGVLNTSPNSSSHIQQYASFYKFPHFIFNYFVFVIEAWLSKAVFYTCLYTYFKQCFRAVCSMLSTLFFPILPWLLQLVWFAWFLIILMYLFNGWHSFSLIQFGGNRLLLSYRH